MDLNWNKLDNYYSSFQKNEFKKPDDEDDPICHRIRAQRAELKMKGVK